MKLAPDDRQISLSLDPLPASVPAARRAVDTLLCEVQPSDEFRFSVRLVVTELMSNGVTHGSSSHPINLELTLHGSDVHVRIDNAVSQPEAKKLADGRFDGGRGLEIVGGLSEAWSVVHAPTGTSATAHISARPTQT